MTESSKSASQVSVAPTLLPNRSFLARSLTWNTKGEQEAPKGPLGLTTLFEPNGQATADLIFVHGLNGGSRSTWSKAGDGTFWPRDWLSCDDAFHDVRIHTFGYSSGLNRESVLDIHDFASNLLACVHHCPTMASMESGPILLVGHSMGGLVIKKAYILAQRTPSYANLVDRIRALVFLATPHQGAGIAQLLSRVIALAGPRPFVDDLVPQSTMLQSINEEFPLYSHSLQLLSFYETKPMFYGTGKSLIVEKHCAVMNYTNEQRAYLDANHRDVARFSTPEDPSYILVRNALANTIKSLRTPFAREEKRPERVDLAALSRILDIFGAPEDQLITHESRKLPGSCQWLAQKDTFQKWLSASTSKLFWLRGRPGAGKSMLASHIISHLRTLDLDCCYFFCKSDDEEMRTTNSLLRSMAWQMAALHPEAFATISTLTNSWKEPPIDKVNHITVWQRIFADVLLKVKLTRPQYWVIDALDECKNNQELIFFLRKAQEAWPLCILVTTRFGTDMELDTTNSPIETISESMMDENNTDIALFLRANLHHLPGATINAQQDISDRILQNSSGCFLWVSLVLRELRHVHTATEITQVLDNNHSDMDALYSNILDQMSRARFGKDVARAILTWVICAFRPLSVDEVHCAVETDIRDSIDDIRKAISTCDNLVFIDRAEKVQLLHLTAREFLTQKARGSEFIIDRSAAHKRLARACIQILCKEKESLKKGSRFRHSASEMTKKEDSALYNYASAYVFQHVLQVDPTDNEIIRELAQFLSSHDILSWIEHLAGQSSLNRLYQAGKDCTNMVSRRTHQTTAIDAQKRLSLVEQWGIDLIRLVTKFGKRLNQSPSSIHYLIPPFCPAESAIRKQFFNAYRGLNVQSCIPTNWDDCVSTISYPKVSELIDMISSGNRTALAFSNGMAVIYDNATLLETNSLLHQERITSMSFSKDGRRFATGGQKTIRVWDLNTSDEVIFFRVPARCMTIAFIEDDEMLLIATNNNLVIYWDIRDNISRAEPIDWTRDIVQTVPRLQSRVPAIVTFSTEQNLLAVAYKGEDILLWTPDGELIYDMYEKTHGSYQYASIETAPGAYRKVTARALAFGSTSEHNFLVASYEDGDIVIFDTDSGEIRGSLELTAFSMACSPDGGILATAGPQGEISLVDLASLRPIGRLCHDRIPGATKRIAFASDDLRVFTIEGRQFNVWDPTVLLRKPFRDEAGDQISYPTAAQNTECSPEESVPITALTCMRDSSAVICGKEDGTVHVYNISSKPHSQALFTQTRGHLITLLHFDDDSYTLSCADTTSRVTSRKLARKPEGTWTSGEIMFDQRGGYRITQIIASLEKGRILVAGDPLDTLWCLPATDTTHHVGDAEGGHNQTWFTSPMNGDMLIRLVNRVATFYTWTSLTQLQSVELVYNYTPLDFRVIPLHHTRYFATVNYSPMANMPWRRVYQLWDSQDLIQAESVPSEGEIHKTSSVLNFDDLGIEAELILGVVDQRVVFLDLGHWVCSVDVVPSKRSTPDLAAAPPSVAKSKAVRHFFIPDDWIDSVSSARLLIGLLLSGDVAFAKKTELAVIRRGLEMTDDGGLSSRRFFSKRLLPRRPADKV
ncbi:hypothetical protein F5Y14DRAFT_396854 [Nemania sp. NC0429]|nr:hypothetical protein F5Y14DRAFT_396854 [Nemania sp. NC0429]